MIRQHKIQVPYTTLLLPPVFFQVGSCFQIWFQVNLVSEPQQTALLPWMPMKCLILQRKVWLPALPNSLYSLLLIIPVFPSLLGGRVKKKSKGKANRVRKEPAEEPGGNSFPGELLPDPITLKEHNIKNKKTGVIFYSIEQRGKLCFKEQAFFPRITDLLSGITADREMQARALVMGKKSWVTRPGCFLGFCRREW